MHLQTQSQAHVIVNETVRGTMLEAELCDEGGGEHDEMWETGKRGDSMNTEICTECSLLRKEGGLFHENKCLQISRCM